MSKVALIIIYNHRFDQNIEKLERIYKSKFFSIFHLVPFYNGDKSNVIPVYESSFYFQGYVAQGVRFFEKEGFDHYFFIADDMILNPIINENNYREIFKLNSETDFISRLGSVPEGDDFWPNNPKALLFDPYKRGVEIKPVLPPAEVASAMLKKFGVKNTSFSFQQAYGKLSIKSVIRYLINRFQHKVSLQKLKYPLVRSYSDIFIISKSTIKPFSQYCGAFAAADLFVELAVPTALILAAKEVRVEKDLRLQGRALWGFKDLELLRDFNYSLNLLLNNFPPSLIYIHPIKLSKWNVENV